MVRGPGCYKSIKCGDTRDVDENIRPSKWLSTPVITLHLRMHTKKEIKPNEGNLASHSNLVRWMLYDSEQDFAVVKQSYDSHYSDCSPIQDILLQEGK